MPGPYKCRKCEKESTSSVKCTNCQASAGSEPFPEYKATPRPINIKGKSSGSVGGQPQATTGAGVATYDPYKDKATQRELGGFIASSPRAGVGRDNSFDPTDGGDGSGGATGQVNTTPTKSRDAGKGQAAEKTPTAQWNEFYQDIDKVADVLLENNKLEARDFNTRLQTYQGMFQKNQASAVEALGNYLNELKAIQKEAGLQAEPKPQAQEAERQQQEQEAERELLAREAAAERERLAQEAEGQRQTQEAGAERERQAAERERLAAAERERQAREAAAERERLAQEAERQRQTREAAAERERLAQEAEGQRQTQEAAAERERQAAERERLAAAERERQAREAAAERERLEREAADKKQPEEPAVAKKAEEPQKGPTPKPPTTPTEVKERAGKLGLSTKEKSAVEALPQKVAASVVVALEGIAALGEAAKLAETRAREDADAKIKDADAKIKDAEAGVKGATAKIEDADAKIEDADTGIQNAVAVIKDADAKIKGAGAKAQAAIDAQFAAMQNALDELWDKLGKHKVPRPGPMANHFNQVMDAALVKYNTHAPGAHAAAGTLLLKLWDELKAKSAEATKDAEAMAGWTDFTTQQQAQTSAENDKAQAESTKVSGQSAKAEAEKERAAAQDAKAEAEDAKAEAETNMAAAGKAKTGAETAAREAAERAAKETAEKAKTATALLNAVRFGPLSRTAPNPDTVPGLSTAEKQQRKELNRKREEAMSAVVADLGDHPQLALDALDVIQRSEHPEAVAGGVAKVAKLQTGNFAKGAANPAQARTMARNALEMGGLLGGDYFDRMNAYYEVHNQSGKPPAPDPMRASGEDATRKTILNYTAGLGRAVLDANGTVNLDAKGAKDLRDALNFHPDSLKNPLPAVALRVEKFRDEFNGPNKAKFVNALESVADRSGAPGLVRTALGMKGSDRVTKQDGKAAVLSAMMTPFAQAQVGSCFATCNCLDYREQKPVEMMQDLAAMVNTGELKKGDLEAPAVKKLPENENALLRSWEYTVASLGGDQEAGDMKETLGSRVHNALVAVQDAVGGDELKKMDRGVSAAERRVNTTHTTYTAAIERRNELVPLFNADNARYRTALDTATAQQDDAKTKYEEAEAAVVLARAEWDVKWEGLKQAARGALSFAYDPTLQRGATAADQRSTMGGWRLKRSDNGEPVDSEEKLQGCLRDAFAANLGGSAQLGAITTVVKSAAFTDSLVSAYADKGSLWAQETGGTAAPSKTVLFEGPTETKPLFPKATGSKAEKTEALLTGMVSSLKDSTDDAVTLGVSGIHAMRALPKHPSLDALKAAPDVGVAVRAELAKAKDIATKPMEEDRVKGLYDKALGSIVGDYLGGNLTGLEEDTNRPAGGKTPKQLKEDILAKAGPRLAEAYEDADAAKEALSAKIDGFLVQELFPQFVIADTNWGDASDRYLHVVAPDPDTGDPVLWIKGELSGSFEREAEKWVDAEWEYTTLKAS